ncbi:PAS domain-containing hybrid sensor histidine kinase/response regulator [Roseateles sp. NT4]|uniref:PAS domain-containing hybrid sensor histidine kinase/response regulator n=1 Tax=Roseateles sp. NT4 TaxID=3453715 RepID=UPI003EED9B11
MNEDEGEHGQALVWSTAHWGDAESTLPELDSELMKLLLENIATRVAVVGRDRRYTYANRETLRFMGLTPEQVIGRHMSEVLDAGVYESLVPLFDRAFAGESLHRRGWTEYAKQGRRYREQWYVPYRPRGMAGDAPVQAVVVCGLDQTEARLGEQELARKQAELRTSEALKAAIFDNALAALVSTDAAGRIVEFNPSAEAMFGHARAAVLGRPVSEVLIPPRFRDAHEQGLQRMQAGEGPRVIGRRLEMHALRADGGEFPMEMVLGRTDAEGAVFYTASIADLSERFEAARQIERQREALRQGEKLTVMGSLLAGLAHELNNPLAIVMGRASLLEDKCEHLPELREDVRRMREAAERCGRIVQTFLNMARNRPSTRGPVALNGIARAAVEMLQYGYRSHGITLELALDETAPDVNADGDQIGQVVMNLLINAQQALASVQGLRRVSVQTGLEPRRANREPRVWLRVSDSGPGVAEAARDRVFEPFFTTKAEGIGTGLGLAVSRSIARDHGGELLLEPAGLDGGGGASFRLSLPISGLAGADSVPGALHEPEAEPSLQARVLVVDDEAELADLIREMLESAGYEVATAESGAVALALLTEARFDAIVSDLRMPVMDGAGLWREVSARHPSLARRMLFVTGDTLSPDAAEFLRRARCAALDKPFSKAALLAQVAELLR